MQNAKPKKINVTATFAAFRTKKFSKRITPSEMMLDSGERLRITHIRRSYAERVGDTQHIHFVVRSDDDRYFDIVYDSKKMQWMLVLELDDFMMGG